ncbi:hypothetical protein PCNPT3_12190 [Psychromonas sp. CNPT3]|uniref:hypothetical protein n=1 Tax=Psychromonas sp. CNPT3 TaxID=314282 RepID=UPI00006E6D83|nr:hypothetical protein [Psychromonas sp. CNPT3]AGH82374.1 hypothetical protein PCNPT3_12190 [Psychromonas sp. CNPT3]
MEIKKSALKEKNHDSEAFNNTELEESKNNSINEEKEISMNSQSILDDHVPSSSKHMYFIEDDTQRILENLTELKKQIYPLHDNFSVEDQTNAPFPSVCLIGLGRCGSNISLDLANLVYNARNYYLNDFQKSGAKTKNQSSLTTQWIKNTLGIKDKHNKHAAFLIEPFVILGDLDQDISGRVHYSYMDGKHSLLDGYPKMKIMDLSEVHAGGSGNAPVLGQYLAKIILNKGAEKFLNKDWKSIHSYLIDSCGIKANQSRLFFYIFSAGGGTGSGMASEFGLAQQYAYMSKTLHTEKKIQSERRSDAHSFVFEPIFSSGICILPNIACQSVEISEALHINAGRLLCKYLSEEWDFSYNVDREDHESDRTIVDRLRPWNSMMLISNDIMRYAEEADGGSMENVDVNTMEKYANQYISQQIFNILTAQAVTKDYDQDYFRRAGVDISDTIRLDANDLFMSLAGPVTIAYAESTVKKTAPIINGRQEDSELVELDIDDLFFRSIDLPHFNKDTRAIEGVSLLPMKAEIYREHLAECRDNNYDTSKLKEILFFNKCSSVVSIISLPKDYKLSYMDLNRLKTHLNSLFPNTTLKRYALVIGASENISLTTLIAKSPCLSDDFLTLIVSYVKRCFAKNEYCFDDNFDDAFLNFITSDDFDEAGLDKMISEFENPAKILDTNWHAIKPMYEKKYREILGDEEKFISINDIRLTSTNVKRAIKYLREIYRYRVSKTKLISLNGKKKTSK